MRPSEELALYGLIVGIPYHIVQASSELTRPLRMHLSWLPSTVTRCHPISRKREMGRLSEAGRALNAAVSFIVFTFLELLDAFLCVVYKLVDFAVEREWKPCYCSSPFAASSVERVAGGGNEGIVIRLCEDSKKLHVDAISATLHLRPSLLSSILSLHRLRFRWTPVRTTPGVAICQKKRRETTRWSDCDCKTCTGWTAGDGLLHVRTGGKVEGGEADDVVFIHGFISSSAFWTETVFREISEEARSSYRLLAVDLLGFGQSPKPEGSLYTVREHVELIECSVLKRHGVRRFHLVAHSLGSILALALAARHPDDILSVTLLSPPYFPGDEGAMRYLAPRKVWPPMAFAASMACWYEHVSRTICLIICRQHRLWNFLIRVITFNRIRTYLIEAFMCHTHDAAWHTLHNVICDNSERLERDLEVVKKNIKCHVNIIHGQQDDLIPLECSYALQSKLPRARLNVVEGKDHITVVTGQQKTFVAELEKIWKEVKN
ncbi:hypothetical protein HPP92_014512 [Vanilla planifolia]|uniref:AB hydrolase-1 domain-containing protein n=1 Tax=Vanilla planifolia TaxID=51239 RepID=A0A835QPM0_VANPL|nr:hypothetical protein HPP92_014512 [Vanilla planifolia]